mgnify:FL=1
MRCWEHSDSKQWYYFAAPVAALLASFATVFAGRIWSQNISAGSCSYRHAFSPYGTAFAIWSLIYLWCDVANAVQVAPVLFKTSNAYGNLCVSFAWILCATWIYLFDPYHKMSIAVAGIVLPAACVLCTVGVTLDDECWKDSEAVLLFLVPNSLLAGWLLVASTLALSTSFQVVSGVEPACLVPGDTSLETRAKRRERNRRGHPYAEAYRRQSLVPPLLSVGVSAVSAFVLKNPIYPLPAAWAILNMGPWGVRPDTNDVSPYPFHKGWKYPWWSYLPSVVLLLSASGWAGYGIWRVDR